MSASREALSSFLRATVEFNVHLDCFLGRLPLMACGVSLNRLMATYFLNLLRAEFCVLSVLPLLLGSAEEEGPFSLASLLLPPWTASCLVLSWMMPLPRSRISRMSS